MLKACTSLHKLHIKQTFVKSHPTLAMALRFCSSNEGDNKRPKAVIFDMGGVVIPSPFKFFKDLENKLSLPTGLISRLIVSEGSDGPWSRLECGILSLSEFNAEFSKVLSKEVGRPVDIGPLFHNLHYNKTEPYPVMVEALKCIRDEGIKTAALTNNWFIDEAKTKSLFPLDSSMYDVIVESCVVGARKPDYRIYNRCLQELHVNAEDVVFLDDLGQNLKAAKQLGMKTIKVKTPEQGIAELEKYLGFPIQFSPPGTSSIPKHLQLDINKLTSYMKSIGLHDNGLFNIRVFEHGQSNPTYYVSFGGEKMVLRKKPPGKLLPSAHAVDREYRVMSSVAKAGVPVPKMISFCEDDSVIGTPFYLMGFIKGCVYKDLRLPEIAPEGRRDIIMAMVDTLAKIHSVDINKVGLSDYGKKGKYVERNFARWVRQYEASKTHEIPSMTKLMEWLPKHFPQNEETTIVHGDYRLDNLILHPDKPQVLATIDWELSTLGDPLTDLATSTISYFLPPDNILVPGLKGDDVKSYSIPTVQEIVAEYCRLRQIPPIDNWDFYVAFVLFRMAAIVQGVYKRAISGQASSSTGEMAGKFATACADLGWEVASKSSLNSAKPKVSPSNTSGVNSSSKRNFSTMISPKYHTVMSTLSRSLTSASSDSTSVGKMAVTVEGLSPRVQDLHKKVKEFIQEHVLPLEKIHVKNALERVNRWQVMPELEEAKEKAKAAGLWNLFLPVESDPEVRYGAGLTNLEYAFLCEEMGKCMLAPEVFNCSAPDTGNMETLVKYGTEEQKEKWLRPLLDGKIRSCFAMTEPAVASSDATNIESSIRREGDEYVINGRKWWTSGALDPRCKICIFMGKTDVGAARHKQQSMILVPMDTPGITIVRPLTVFGYDDAPEGHGEVLFENVRVPASNILLGEGRGFEIAQGRLGPGRIHHCMRLIGYAERALGLMLERTMNRVAFGKPLAKQGTIQQDVARSRIEIEQCRLLVLKAAYMMDLYGNKIAAPEIAMIKVAAPNMAQAVIDRAIQAHGGAGLNHDVPLAPMFAAARSLRLADGPDEVHRRSIAGMEYIRNRKSQL